MGLFHRNRLHKNQIETISLRSSLDGKLWTPPSNPNPPPNGRASGLLPIDAISCHGCDVIRSANGCNGAFEEA